MGNSYRYITQLPGATPTTNDTVIGVQNGTSSQFKVSDILSSEVTRAQAAESALNTKIDNLINDAPEALNTLKELADALGDDANFAATMATSLSNKVDKITGKSLSTNDFTNDYKAKLDGIAVNATKTEASSTNGNIKINGSETTVFTQSQADWNQTDNTKSDYIKNKPTDLLNTMNNTLSGHTTDIVNINTSLSGKANLTTTPQKTISDITYYVDITNGNDSTGDGLTSGTAFKTIQYAINKLPQVINHNVIINVASGTSIEDITVSGFFGKGTLKILGSSALDTTRKINSITFKSCPMYCELNGICVDSNANIAINVVECVHVEIILTNVLKATQFGISSTASRTRTLNSSISNTSKAMISNTLGELYTFNNVGTGNQYSLVASSGGTIVKGNETIPTATTPTFTDTGGVIR